jgi:hypothetical protein
MMVEDTYDGIMIVGEDRAYVERVKKALEKAQASSYGYPIIKQYIGLIQEVKPPSGMRAYANPPAFGMSRSVAFANEDEEFALFWCASSIVHDAYHSKLYRDYADDHWHVPASVWTGQKAELECNKHQIMFLEGLGAHGSTHIIEHLTRYLKGLDGRHYAGPIDYGVEGLATPDTDCCLDVRPPHLLAL